MLLKGVPSRGRRFLGCSDHARKEGFDLCRGRYRSRDHQNRQDTCECPARNLPLEAHMSLGCWARKQASISRRLSRELNNAREGTDPSRRIFDLAIALVSINANLKLIGGEEVQRAERRRLGQNSSTAFGVRWKAVGWRQKGLARGLSPSCRPSVQDCRLLLSLAGDPRSSVCGCPPLLRCGNRSRVEGVHELVRV